MLDCCLSTNHLPESKTAMPPNDLEPNSNTVSLLEAAIRANDAGEAARLADRGVAFPAILSNGMFMDHLADLARMALRLKSEDVALVVLERAALPDLIQRRRLFLDDGIWSGPAIAHLAQRGALNDLPQDEALAALSNCAKFGVAESARALADAGALAYCTGNHAISILDSASSHLNAPVLQAWVDRGLDRRLLSAPHLAASVDFPAAYRPGADQVSVLHMAAAGWEVFNSRIKPTPWNLEAASATYRAFIDFALANGVGINQRDSAGRTALMALLQRTRALPEVVAGAAVRVLLDRGADPQLPDTAGCSPAIEAAMYWQTSALEALLAKGSSLECPLHETDTLLHAAVHLRHGRLEPGSAEHAEFTATLAVLQRAGLDINCRNRHGDTALGAALLKPDLGQIAALVAAGASCDAVDAQGMNAAAKLRQYIETEQVHPERAQECLPLLDAHAAKSTMAGMLAQITAAASRATPGTP